MKDLDKKRIIKFLDSVCLILGIIVIFIYFGLYMFKQPIVSEEVRPEVTNNLLPWEVKSGDNFIIAMLTRPFDLKLTELGQYRPRYLSFLVQFIDENIFFKLTRMIPLWGNRQIFYIITMILMVLSIFSFIKNICPKISKWKGLTLLISSSALMFQNYQVATYWRARAGKLLAVPVCIFLITFIIKNLNVNITKNNIKRLLYSIPIFLLMTLDEQVLAIVILLTGLSFLFSIINKKINLVSLICLLSCLIYISFHVWWGKALFSYFTGGLQKHGHTIAGSINGISLKTLKESIEILMSTIPKMIFMSILVFIVIWIICLIKLITNKEMNKVEKLKKITISVFLTVSPIVLLMLMIDSHSAIYTLPCLWKSIYPLISTVILFLSLIYLLGNSEFKTELIKYIVILIGMLTSLIYNISNVNSYYGAYLTNKGGFMNTITDLVVTKNDVHIKARPIDQMDIDSDNLIAQLNTIFSTNNFKTSKILYGKYDNNYIKDDFACYLVVKQNRNLNLKIELKDYTKFDSLSIVINDKKIKTIHINNNFINQKIYVSPEINRACKVRLIFNTNEKINKRDIKLKQLYMN